MAVGQDVCKFFLDAFGVGFGAPLEALQKFGRFDGNALREILGRVELTPVSLNDEFAQGAYRAALGIGRRA